MTAAAPPWLDTHPSASREYGNRTIHWTLPTDLNRKVHGCVAVWAWITVVETSPLSGEVGRVSATRRLSDDGPREPFTDRAREAIAADVAPYVAAIGFDNMWNSVDRCAAEYRAGQAEQAAKQARTAAAWFDDAAELERMHRDGSLTVVPIHRVHGERPLRLQFPTLRFPYGTETMIVIAELVHSGNRVGWMTDSYQLVPVFLP